jgi:hypothetical protein
MKIEEIKLNNENIKQNLLQKVDITQMEQTRKNID